MSIKAELYAVETGSILDKVRELNSIFRFSSTNQITLDELCKKLSEILSANIYLFDREGFIFSHATAQKFYCYHNEKSLRALDLPQQYLEIFEMGEGRRFNVYEKDPPCTCEDVSRCIFENRYYALLPVYYSHEKRAGILLIRYGSAFNIEEEMLCEYASAIVSMELMRIEQEQIRAQSTLSARASLVVDLLSFAELQAALTTLKALEPGTAEGQIQLNMISAKAYVTPSMVSATLKKLETAGVITTKSMGVRGKYLWVNNPYLLPELEQRATE